MVNPPLPLLLLDKEIETRAILKKLARAHSALAELKGVAASIPNQEILIHTLALQEARDSSAIENIITTQDDLLRSDSQTGYFATIAAREVHDYAGALLLGFEAVQNTGLLLNNDILRIQARIEHNRAGFRKLPGTALLNVQGETVYMPPQHAEEILVLMGDLEAFINGDSGADWDDLTKMAVIHHQFESIHPFYDGNGRTGRILNVLYLVKQGLLGSPVLYLSRYINRNKADYYRLLQKVRSEGDWEAWLGWMLDGVEQTSHETTALIRDITALMQGHKDTIRAQLPKVYSQDLVNNLFRHPYTKIEFLMNELGITRQTSARYLEALIQIGLLSRHKVGKENFYLNEGLNALLLGVGEKSQAKP